MLTSEEAKEMNRRSLESRRSAKLKYAMTIPDKLREELKTSTKPLVAEKYGINVRQLYRIINGK